MSFLPAVFVLLSVTFLSSHDDVKLLFGSELMKTGKIVFPKEPNLQCALISYGFLLPRSTDAGDAEQATSRAHRVKDADDLRTLDHTIDNLDFSELDDDKAKGVADGMSQFKSVKKVTCRSDDKRGEQYLWDLLVWTG